LAGESILGRRKKRKNILVKALEAAWERPYKKERLASAFKKKTRSDSNYPGKKKKYPLQKKVEGS